MMTMGDTTSRGYVKHAIAERRPWVWVRRQTLAVTFWDALLTNRTHGITSNRGDTNRPHNAFLTGTPMKLTPKRADADTTKSAVTAIQSAALGPIAPPKFVTVRKQDRPLWDAIVMARPRDTWNDADLILAGHLARAYGDMAHLEAHIDRNGMVVEEKLNPACAMLDKATRRALALARQLKVDAISTVGKSRDIRKGSELESDARKNMGDDELIPRTMQ